MSATQTLPPPRLFVRGSDEHLLPQLAKIQALCIEQDNQLATFLPPLDIPTMTTFWIHTAQSAGHNPTCDSPSGCEIILQMAQSSSSDSPAGGREGEVVAGYVVLGMSWSQTGPFRANVLKLMVHPSFRRRGVARRVMDMLEDVARERERGLLMLDTRVGSDAESVYPRLGYTRLGVVPKYGIDPRTGELVDEVFFFKDLREEW